MKMFRSDDFFSDWWKQTSVDTSGISISEQICLSGFRFSLIVTRHHNVHRIILIETQTYRIREIFANAAQCLSKRSC